MSLVKIYILYKYLIQTLHIYEVSNQINSKLNKVKYNRNNDQ